ncbi:signal peptidase I [Candidatus Chlorohelix allophototropha]|uniref:Signal peptidase I n=2 Tax=Candidatus Chlorohelix allophototropha TaxID=3003348 RepID=A0ABY9B5F9_9CHLR|nr:signal peptidase I [Chloroflexota bacterium L227-S17]
MSEENNYKPQPTLPQAMESPIVPQPTSEVVVEQYGYRNSAADASAEPMEGQIVSEESQSLDDLPTTSPVPAKAVSPKPHKSFWREVLETVILTILIFFLAQSLIQPFRIQGSSMEPNFHTDQLLMVNKAAYFHFDVNPWLRLIPGVKAEGSSVWWVFGGPKRGDVVVFEYPRDPSQDYIKRVIGFPGEKVEVRSGVVYVNDQPLTEPYIKEASLSPYGPMVVPEGTLFVLGDNRNGSSDSRAWGFLPIDRIIGKAMIAYWPLGKGWGIVNEASYN